jgi:SAM-dependent methyltransferase
MRPPQHPCAPASPWISRWAPHAAPGCAALDLACGQGRHVRLLQQLGYAVHAVDRDAPAIAEIGSWLTAQGVSLVQLQQRLRCHDLEANGWPYGAQRFGLIVVSRYLWRPLLPALLQALDPDGLLIYETFARAQATLGTPRNPDFLLAPGELLEIAACGRLEVMAYEDGYELAGQLLPAPGPAQVPAAGGRYLQRLAARRPWREASDDPPQNKHAGPATMPASRPYSPRQSPA